MPSQPPTLDLHTEDGKVHFVSLGPDHTTYELDGLMPWDGKCYVNFSEMNHREIAAAWRVLDFWRKRGT